MRTFLAPIICLGVCLGLCLAFLACAGKAPAPARPLMCPEPGTPETALDCPWAQYTRALSLDAQGGLRPELPRAVSSGVQTDASHLWSKSLWGESINYDEFMKAVIVQPEILAALSRDYGTPVREVTLPSGILVQIPHAGLEHTYGYLFSNLQTTFGYKRARWVSGEIERGFFLPDGLLGPHPARGTFLSNVSYFLGRIAFRGQALQLGELAKGRAQIAPELRDFNYAGLRPIRVTETTPLATLRTDLVPFTRKSRLVSDADSYLLVYSLATPYGEPKLITAFPVSESFVQGLLKDSNFGPGKEITTRYNAYLEGLSGRKVMGTRTRTPSETQESK